MYITAQFPEDLFKLTNKNSKQKIILSGRNREEKYYIV